MKLGLKNMVRNPHDFGEEEESFSVEPAYQQISWSFRDIEENEFFPDLNEEVAESIFTKLIESLPHLELISSASLSFSQSHFSSFLDGPPTDFIPCWYYHDRGKISRSSGEYSLLGYGYTLVLNLHFKEKLKKEFVLDMVKYLFEFNERSFEKEKMANMLAGVELSKVVVL